MANVKIAQGILAGGKSKTTNGFEYFEFLNVPYAEPPVGDLRFKSPQPPKPWEGKRDATQNNLDNICRQTDLFSSQTVGTEDCLYLNVYSPKLPDDEIFQFLPVIVYIHGGGFVVANGIDKNDNGPDFLITHDVVVVTINYRLNVFGFLSLDIPEAAGNMGLKDQIQALKWVKENIVCFGGDPHNVTVMGISAGAASVEYLLLSKLNNGLFSKAIMQSGSSLNPWAIRYDIVDLSVKVALNIGYQGPETDMKATHAYLMAQSTDILADAAVKTVSEFNIKSGLNFGFVPSIEKDFKNGEAFLTTNPYIILKSGEFNRVPTIRGFCEYEGLINIFFAAQALKKLKEERNFLSLWTYPVNRTDVLYFNDLFQKEYMDGQISEQQMEAATIDFFGHWEFASGIITSTKISASHKVPSFLYMFAYDTPNTFVKTLFKIDKKGASHGDDMKYVIKSTRNIIADDKREKTDIIIGEKICKMWTNFAKTGNPTPATENTLPLEWLAFENEDQSYLVIDEVMEIRKKYQPKKINIFEEMYEKYNK